MSRKRTEAVPYLKLLLLAALLGIISAEITLAFQNLVRIVQVLVWRRAASVFTLVVCAFGGLMVGMLVRTFGDHSGIFAEMMTEFGRTGPFNYRRAPGMVMTALVSLIAGAVLAPRHRSLTRAAALAR